MGDMLVFAEQHDDVFTAGSLGLLAEAARLAASLGVQADAVVCGSSLDDQACAALGGYGATRVVLADHEALASGLPQPAVDAIARVVADGGYTSVLLGASVLASDIAAALSARLDAGLIVDGVDISAADTLVAGGRGLGSPDGFRLLEALAHALGGEVAATRAVVDSGWYPYSAQVGQTGKTVNPKLYIAAGISGAIQHKVGMQGAATIIAINKDTHAPIFDYADLAITGDLNTIIPKLTDAITARKG